MKYFFLTTGFYCCVLFFSCSNAEQEKGVIKPVQDSGYIDLAIPSFETVKILSLDKTIYNSISDTKIFDSLVKNKIVTGSFDNFTFLDSLGNPLSSHFDSLVLNKVQTGVLLSTLGKCYAKDNPGFPLCGSRIKDAIVFYDSNNKPFGFIELGFSCNVYYFSKSLKMNTENCNTDSMMKNFSMLFNSLGITRNSFN